MLYKRHEMVVSHAKKLGFENWIFNLLPSEVRDIETQQNEIVGIEIFPENLYTCLLEEGI